MCKVHVCAYYASMCYILQNNYAYFDRSNCAGIIELLSIYYDAFPFGYARSVISTSFLRICMEMCTVCNAGAGSGFQQIYRKPF